MVKIGLNLVQVAVECPPMFPNRTRTRQGIRHPALGGMHGDLKNVVNIITLLYSILFLHLSLCLEQKIEIKKPSLQAAYAHTTAQQNFDLNS